jgi:sarcosine oxidase
VRALDAIMIGLGGMGSAAAAHLAERGQRVLGLEQFQPGHDRGSSHGRSRVIRLAYFEHPSYVPLLLRAYQLWDRLARDAGHPLLQLTGGLMIGSPESEVVLGSHRSAIAHGLEHEMLEAAEIRRRFPAFTASPGVVALFEPRAGVLDPEQAIRSHLARAVAEDAVLQFDERVLAWEASAGGVVVRTSRGVYEAGRLVLAPGAWASELFKLDLPLEVEPQVLYWFNPTSGAEAFKVGRFPIYIWDLGDGVQFYGFPADSRGTVKVAFFRTKNGDEGAMRMVLAACVPSLAEGRLVETATCRYTLTPDHHFVIGLHPEQPNVVMASPCSGHGFKFASVVGEILADLAIDGATAHPIGLFAPTRFKDRRA